MSVVEATLGMAPGSLLYGARELFPPDEALRVLELDLCAEERALLASMFTHEIARTGREPTLSFWALCAGALRALRGDVGS